MIILFTNAKALAIVVTTAQTTPDSIVDLIMETEDGIFPDSVVESDITTEEIPSESTSESDSMTTAATEETTLESTNDDATEDPSNATDDIHWVE